MKKPIEKEITETWNIFSDNLILFVPDACIQCLNLLVYGAIVGLFATSFTADLSFSGFDFRNPLSFPFDQIEGFIKQFITYICGSIAVLFFYHFLIGIIHGAGWNNMFSKAATTGSASISDYFSGITKFSARMFWATAIRMSILWLPWLVIGCMTAAFALNSGSESNGAPAVVFILGIPVCFIANLVTRFLMMMWKPAMFTRDMQPIDSLLEASNFILRQMSNLIVFLLIWVIFKILVGRISGLFLTTFNSDMFQNGFNHRAYNIDWTNIVTPLAVWAIVWTIMYCARIFAIVFCFKFYSEKFDEPAPVKVPRQYPPHPAAPQQPYYGNIPYQYTGVPYPQQPYPQQQNHPKQQNLPNQQQPYPQQNFPPSQYAPPPVSQHPQPAPPPFYYPPQPPQSYYQPSVPPYPYQQPPANYQQPPAPYQQPYPQYQPPYQPQMPLQPPQTPSQPPQPSQQPPQFPQQPQYQAQQQPQYQVPPPPPFYQQQSIPSSPQTDSAPAPASDNASDSHNDIPSDNLTQAFSGGPDGENGLEEPSGENGGDEQRPLQP